VFASGPLTVVSETLSAAFTTLVETSSYATSLQGNFTV